MTKVYSKGTWVDEVLSGEPRYNTADDGGTPIDTNIQINLSTSVAVAGTEMSADIMNNIENGIDALDNALVAGNATNIHAATGKTTPVDADEVELIDSAASYTVKKLTWANIKATLKTYLDTLYIPLQQNDGWVSAAATWTYASATTINVPSGAASIYSVGDRIRFTQSATVKYAYVVGIADTLLTVAGDAVANSAISANSYSKRVSPVGFPQWFAWVPSLTTGVATLPSYTYARFSIMGRTCTIVCNVDNVSIGGAPGSVKVTLPVTSAIASTFWGNCARYLTADGYVPIRGVLTSAYVEVFKSISTTNYVANETGYYLRIAGSYEI